MRIYCWDYPSYDAVPEEYKKHSLAFIDDTEDGVLCHCGYCGEEIEIYINSESCPKCGKDLIYPRADW